MTKMLAIETERLTITEFTLDMAEDVQKNSLDEDNRRKALQYISEKQQGRIILLCSHEDDELQDYTRIDL